MVLWFPLSQWKRRINASTILGWFLCWFFTITIFLCEQRFFRIPQFSNFCVISLFLLPFISWQFACRNSGFLRCYITLITWRQIPRFILSEWLVPFAVCFLLFIWVFSSSPETRNICDYFSVIVFLLAFLEFLPSLRCHSSGYTAVVMYFAPTYA